MQNIIHVEIENIFYQVMIIRLSEATKLKSLQFIVVLASYCT